MDKYDVIVVGAGFSGAVMAERFASQLGKRVLVLEQRDHIAGNCYDYRNAQGILVHKYGPHLFHTSKDQVWQYLSEFTEWTPYEHKVLSSVDNQLVPLPFNLNTLEKMYPTQQAQSIENKLVSEFGFGGKVPILELRKHTDPMLRDLAEVVYSKFFVNYTTKQWGCAPEDISPAVTARVPVVVSRDDRYFHDKYQAIPAQGYTRLIGNILDHGNIEVSLNTDAQELLTLNGTNGEIDFDGRVFSGKLVYTGMLDSLFDYVHGELPYRSLKFEFETLKQGQYQPGTTVNYPNDFAFTRITEFKHILGCQSEHTTIVREYPQDYDRLDPSKNVPYYPVFNDSNQHKYNTYRSLSERFSNLIALGRLADYKYYNMDDAVANALTLFTEFMAQDGQQHAG